MIEKSSLSNSSHYANMIKSTEGLKWSENIAFRVLTGKCSLIFIMQNIKFYTKYLEDETFKIIMMGNWLISLIKELVVLFECLFDKFKILRNVEFIHLVNFIT